MSTDYGIIAAGVAAVALLYSLALFISVRRQDPGNAKMMEIASAVRVGANAFLRREYTVIAPVAVAISILIFMKAATHSTPIPSPARNGTSLLILTTNRTW